MKTQLTQDQIKALPEGAVIVTRGADGRIYRRVKLTRCGDGKLHWLVYLKMRGGSTFIGETCDNMIDMRRWEPA